MISSLRRRPRQHSRPSLISFRQEEELLGAGPPCTAPYSATPLSAGPYGAEQFSPSLLSSVPHSAGPYNCEQLPSGRLSVTPHSAGPYSSDQYTSQPLRTVDNTYNNYRANYQQSFDAGYRANDKISFNKNKFTSVPKHYRGSSPYLHESDDSLLSDKKYFRRSSSRECPVDYADEPVVAAYPSYETSHFQHESLQDDRDRESLHPDSYYTKEDGKKRSASVSRKQNSFRMYRGYPVNAESPSLGPGTVGTLSRSVGAVSRSVGGVVKRRKHVVLLGLDGSGKTTILMRLKYRCFVATAPTVGFNHEKVWGGGFRWSAWDVGGGERLRPLWPTYTRATDGIVYVVDASANTDTMEEARLELVRIMKLSKATSSQLSRSAPPLLVLANFQDRSVARCAPEVAKCLGLPQEGQVGPAGGGSVAASCWAVACVCGLTGDGLDEAMATLRHLMDRGDASPKKTKNKQMNRWR